MFPDFLFNFFFLATPSIHLLEYSLSSATFCSLSHFRTCLASDLSSSKHSLTCSLALAWLMPLAHSFKHKGQHLGYDLRIRKHPVWSMQLGSCPLLVCRPRQCSDFFLRLNSLAHLKQKHWPKSLGKRATKFRTFASFHKCFTWLSHSAIGSSKIK